MGAIYTKPTFIHQSYKALVAEIVAATLHRPNTVVDAVIGNSMILYAEPGRYIRDGAPVKTTTDLSEASVVHFTENGIRVGDTENSYLQTAHSGATTESRSVPIEEDTRETAVFSDGTRHTEFSWMWLLREPRRRLENYAAIGDPELLAEMVEVPFLVIGTRNWSHILTTSSGTMLDWVPVPGSSAQLYTLYDRIYSLLASTPIAWRPQYVVRSEEFIRYVMEPHYPDLVAASCCVRSARPDAGHWDEFDNTGKEDGLSLYLTHLGQGAEQLRKACTSLKSDCPNVMNRHCASDSRIDEYCDCYDFSAERLEELEYVPQDQYACGCDGDWIDRDGCQDVRECRMFNTGLRRDTVAATCAEDGLAEPCDSDADCPEGTGVCQANGTCRCSSDADCSKIGDTHTGACVAACVSDDECEQEGYGCSAETETCQRIPKTPFPIVPVILGVVVIGAIVFGVFKLLSKPSTEDVELEALLKNAEP
jgi:hypothetical protein